MSMHVNVKVRNRMCYKQRRWFPLEDHSDTQLYPDGVGLVRPLSLVVCLEYKSKSTCLHVADIWSLCISGMMEPHDQLTFVVDLLPTVTALIRGPFGRHAWVMQLRHSPRIKRVSSSKFCCHRFLIKYWDDLGNYNTCNCGYYFYDCLFSRVRPNPT